MSCMRRGTSSGSLAALRALQRLMAQTADRTLIGRPSSRHLCPEKPGCPRGLPLQMLPLMATGTLQNFIWQGLAICQIHGPGCDQMQQWPEVPWLQCLPGACGECLAVLRVPKSASME